MNTVNVKFISDNGNMLLAYLELVANLCSFDTNICEFLWLVLHYIGAVYVVCLCT